jgi:hypothetical protein
MKWREFLADRLRQVRLDKYGENGGPLLAKEIGIPTRTWIRFESGDPIPSPVLLRFMELTGVDPQWLLSGEGETYRECSRRAQGAWFHPEAN